ncbi:MAG TPA: NfeD family protein [Planctomycetota bacterium]|nr:NfeD family protein [Planctomycetota bacterium]
MLALALAAWTALAPQAGGDVAHLRVHGALDAGTQSSLRRAVETARELTGEGRPRLLLELDTPGGEVELMWSLAGQLDAAAQSGVDVTCWVHDRALSAGALLAMACKPLYMRPQANIGAAAPVALAPGGGIAAVPDETVRLKVTSALRSSFRAWAEAHDRPAALAEAMVDPDAGARRVRVDGEVRLVGERDYEDLRMRGAAFELVETIAPPGTLLSLSGAQAVELGLADGLASSLDEVLAKLGGGRAVAVERTRGDELAAWLDTFKYVLLVAGLLAAWTEVKAPGFGLPGIVSIACIGLFLFGRFLVGLADVPHVVAVTAGVVLLAVEVFVAPGTLWFGLAGGLLLVGGLVSATVWPVGGLDMPMAQTLLVDEAFRFTLGLTAVVVGAWVLGRFLPQTPLGARLVLGGEGSPLTGSALGEAADLATKRGRLIGARGTALTDLRPVGKVRLDAESGDDFEARADGAALDRGARVRVVDVSSGRLVVAPDAEATP